MVKPYCAALHSFFFPVCTNTNCYSFHQSFRSRLSHWPRAFHRFWVCSWWSESWLHQRKHHSSVSLAFVRGIHRWPLNPCTTGLYCRIWWRHHVMYNWIKCRTQAKAASLLHTFKVQTALCKSTADSDGTTGSQWHSYRILVVHLARNDRQTERFHRK